MTDRETYYDKKHDFKALIYHGLVAIIDRPWDLLWHIRPGNPVFLVPKLKYLDTVV